MRRVTDLTRLNGFLRDCRANVAVLFALSSVAVLLVAGAAVDFVSIIMYQQEMQASLDAATLAGVAATRDSMDTGKSFSASKAIGVAAANATFKANWTNANTAQTVFDITYTGLELLGVGDGKAVIKNTFMGLAGSPTTQIKVDSQSISNVTPYRDLYLLVDVSTSMLLPSTQNGISQMIAGTGCALACHDNSGGTNKDSYNWALGQGIELRYQTVNKGVGQLLDYLDSDATLKDHTRTGLWSFDSLLHANAAMTTNHQSVKQSYPGPSLAANDDVAATPFSSYIDNFVATVGTGGDGSSQSQAQKIVFLASDGVNDPTRRWVSDTSLRSQVKVFDTAFCKKLKDNKVTLAIINTPYYPMPTDWGYAATLGQPGTLGGSTRVDDIPIALEGCAGSLFLVASDQTGLQGAFKTLFDRLVTTRIAQ